jgi:asparagine synthase (glutamine-hydrolysing)
MCGIAGIVVRDPSADSPRDQERLIAALDRLRHRGPDDVGFYTAPGVRVGNRRLAIQDLTAAGHQPMLSRGGSTVLVFNGEIYNYLELRRTLERAGHTFGTRTDTEVVLAAFDEWGGAALDRFRGMFALALWNTRSGRLLLARDRVGEKPLFYWRDGARLVFASEIKALLELIPQRPQISAEDVNTYLHFQYVIEPRTMLDGVRKLAAGHTLEVGADVWHATPVCYWSLESIPPVDGEPVPRLREQLEISVDLMLRSDAPVGIALSGGIDSSIIAAIAARTRRDVAAFTVGYPGRPSFDERNAAQDLAAALDLPWHSAELPTGEFAHDFPELVAGMDEPIADVAAYGHQAVARLAASHGVKVLLTGIGGDELFFGYGWVREALRLSRLKIDMRRRGSASARARAALLRRLLLDTPLFNLAANRRLPAWWRQRVDRLFDAGKLDLEHPDEWVFYQLDYHWNPSCRFAPQVLSDRFRSIPDRAAYRLMSGLAPDGGDAHVAVCRLLFDSWLVSNCLALGDRVSMAASVEARMPLMEVGLVEAVVGLWRAGRTDDAQGHKLWLRAVAADLLPPDVVNRPKRGFMTPTAEWMAAVNGQYAPQLLNGTLVESGVLDGDRLRGWLGRTPATLHRDFFQYKLTLLEVWHRAVCHGERAHDVRTHGAHLA